MTGRNTHLCRIENNLSSLDASQRKVLCDISRHLLEEEYTVAQLRKQLRGIKKTRVKKAPNAYAAYVKQQWKQVATENPDAKFVEARMELRPVYTLENYMTQVDFVIVRLPNSKAVTRDNLQHNKRSIAQYAMEKDFALPLSKTKALGIVQKWLGDAYVEAMLLVPKYVQGTKKASGEEDAYLEHRDGGQVKLEHYSDWQSQMETKYMKWKTPQSTRANPFTNRDYKLQIGYLAKISGDYLADDTEENIHYFDFAVHLVDEIDSIAGALQRAKIKLPVEDPEEAVSNVVLKEYGVLQKI